MKTKSVKFLAFVLSLLLAVSCIPISSVSAGDGTMPASKLQNLWHLLQDENETELKIAYLGGSVTVGAGASDSNTTSWRALVGKWFVDTFGPGTDYNKNVTNVHGAIGATGSYFGSYRVWQDCELGSENPPDVLFVEFAINDIYDVTTQTQTEINYESIIRQAYKANPKINVIPVFTMDINIAYNWLNTGSEGSMYYEVQRTLADYYGLPQVNVGQALINVINADYISAGKALKTSDSSDPSSIWRKYITDTCHPGDAGYAVYAQTVIDYITQQLGDAVSHDADVVSVDLASTPSYASTKGNGAHLKENGRYISFKDAGFTAGDLHGWTLITTSGESNLASSNGRITTGSRNASFAFKFTGTAVGFFNYGKPTSGTLEYTITSTADPAERYTGEVSLVKNYTGGLPFPGELKTGLPNKEWLVECVIKDVGKGSDGDLRYIYIDGDTASIVPAKAPDTALPPITVDASHYTEVYGGSIGVLTTYKGLPAKLVTPDKSSGQQPQVDYYKYNSLATKISFPSYKYVAVTYYYEPNGSDKATEFSMQLDQLIYNGSATGWLPGTADFPISIARQTAPIISNKWVTQYFDFGAFAEAADTKRPGSHLYQGRHYPFGVIAGNTMTGTEKSWFHGITFSQTLPAIYNSDGEKISCNDGSAIAYVSSTGSVTTGGKTFDAYETIAEAIDALSPVGGKILVSGSAAFTDGSSARGKIIIEGVDSAALITNVSLSVKNGDLELKNITMTGATDEYWTETCGHTLTLGEGFVVEKNIRFGATPNSGGKPTNIVMYAGKIIDSAAMSGYGQTITVTGDSQIDIYGGSVTNISGISRNGIAASGIQTINGNVIYNFYGGNFSGNFTTTTTSGKINGNLWYNINGGIFASGSAIGFGDRQGYGTLTPNDTRATVVNGNQIIVVNNKQIAENGGKLSGVKLGTEFNNGIYNSDAGKFVILNNAEFAGNTGAAIHTSNIADYAISVSYGSAAPVFEEDGTTLKGFRILPDIEGLVPSMDGEKLVADQNGLYQIEVKSGIVRNVVFDDPSSLDILFTDGDNTHTVAAKQNSTLLIPAALFTKDGYIFAGWKKDGDDTIYAPGESYVLGLEPVSFTAQWIPENDLTTIYVDPDASVSGSGVVRSSPVKTFKEAQTIMGDYSKDFTIILMGELSIGSYSHCFDNTRSHTGRITVDGEGVGVIKFVDSFYPMGPVTLQNLGLRITTANNFFDGNTNHLIFGENITMLPVSDTDATVNKPKFHIGSNNTNSAYHYMDVYSGDLSTVYVGSSYVDQGKQVTSDGARIHIAGGKVASLQFIPDAYGTKKGSVLWTNAPSVVISGGTVSAVSFSATPIPENETAHASKYVTYTYPAQLVLNNGITSVPSGFDESKHIIVKSAVGGTVDVTKTPGVFSIKSDSNTVYINGVLAEKAEDNLYTFSTPGTYNISYTMVDLEYAPGMDDVQGETVRETVTGGSVITLAQNTYTREGFEFAGWFDGENHYAAGASYTLGANVKFTPVWKNAANNRAYLSASAYVDTNGDGRVDLKPFNTMGETINSITAAEGGTIYICGYYKGGLVETSNATRGPITFRGVDDNISQNKLDLENTSNAVFNKNDVTFDSVTIKAPIDELFISTDGGHTITFGENLQVESRFCDYTTWSATRYLYVGSHGAANGTSNYVINGGEFAYIMSGGNYNASTAHNGDVYYTVNGGTFHEYYGGSRNSSGKNQYNTNGNVYHTINGGTFKNNLYLGSHKADKVSGNVIFTVNGGNFQNKSIVGGHVNYVSGAPIAGKNAAVIVNNKNVGADDNFTGLVLGRAGYGNNIGGPEIYIINNAEINTGVKIHAESTAGYRLRTMGGSAVPVFDAGVGGELLGFDITSDAEGLVPYVGQTEIPVNANGYYELAADTAANSFIDITFAAPSAYVSIGGTKVYADAEYKVTAIDGVVDFQNSVAPEKTGGLFVGWYYENGEAVTQGAVLAAGTVIEAKFADFVTAYGAEGANFVVEGAQIRLNGEPALRFVNNFGKELKAVMEELTENFAPSAETDTGIGYGYVVLPESLLGGKKLTKETKNVGVVPAVKTYKDFEDHILYTVCITGIQDYTRNYVVVPYITYTDAQGYERTAYGEEYSANMAAIAAMVLDNEELTEEQITALKTIAGR